MLSFLPDKIKYFINQFDLDKLYEIRIRIGYGLKLNVDNKTIFIPKEKLICDEFDIDYILKSITEQSLYAFNEFIKKGFITTKLGVRIGLAGECVFDNKNILTIKNITSLNIRVPHLIKSSIDKVFNYILDKDVYSTLIVSPPFFGKTTMLKAIAKKLDLETNYNILIVDERNEFCNICGKNIDSIKYCDKHYAFSYGVRSMSPDVIITDELMSENDWKSVEIAIKSGVKVIASCHGKNLRHVVEKEYFINQLFDRYIVLNSKGRQPGIIDKVYNGEMIEI